MAAVDINRFTAGVQLRPNVVKDIWAEALEDSAIAAVTPTIVLPGNGIAIDVVTGEPEAQWVGETEEKPVDDHSFGTKTLRGYKAAVIELFSDEFIRDKNALYSELVRRLPKALGRLLDATVLGRTAVPGADFDTLAAAPAHVLGGPNEVGDDILEINAQIAAAGHDLSGWAVSPQGHARLIGARDASGNLLFSQDFRQNIIVDRILGKPVYKSKALFEADAVDGDKLGIAGDWSQARLGYTERITMKMSDQATINKGGTQVNLFQRNMKAVLVEFEVGYVVNDINAFVSLTAPVAEEEEEGGE